MKLAEHVEVRVSLGTPATYAFLPMFICCAHAIDCAELCIDSMTQRPPIGFHDAPMCDGHHLPPVWSDVE